MRRFVRVIVLVILISIASASREVKAEQECKCSQGEENCPCLAQKSPSQTAGLSLNLPHMNEKELLDLVGSKVQKKKVAKPEKKEMRTLKDHLRKLKMKIKMLKQSIKRAPLPAKQALIAKEKGFESECLQTKAKIKELKLKLKKLKKLYKEECIKKVKEKMMKAKKIIRALGAKEAKLKKEIKEVKDTMKVAKIEDISYLKRKMKSLKIVHHKILIKMQKAKRFIIKVQNAKRLVAKLKLKKTLVKKDKIMKLKKKKLEKVKEKKHKLTILITSMSKKMQKLIAKMKREESPKRKLKLKKKLEVARQAVTYVKKQKEKLQKKELAIKASIKLQVTKMKGIKKALKKKKSDKKCLKLQTKLINELKIVKKLKVVLEKECSKTLQTRKEQGIKHILAIKHHIHRARKQIEKIKKKIQTAPSKMQKTLKKKMKRVIKKLKAKEKKLAILKQKIKAIVAATKKAQKEDGPELERKKLKLIQKASHIKDKIVNYKKKINLISIKHKKCLEDVVSKEEMKSRKLVASARMKLKMAIQEAKELEKAIKIAQQLVTLKEEWDKNARIILETQDAALKADLKKTQAELKAKMAKLAKIEFTLKRRAEALHHEIEAKTNMELLKEKKALAKKERKIEQLMKEAIEREEDIHRALIKAQDETIKEVLGHQLKIEKHKLYQLNKELKDSQTRREAIEHELVYQKRREKDLERMVELQRSLLFARFKAKVSLLKQRVHLDSKKRLNDLLAKEKLKGEEELSFIKKKIAMEKAEYEAYKLARKTANRRKILESLHFLSRGYKMMIKRLQAELKDAVHKLPRFKIELSKNSNKMLKAEIDKLNKKAKFDIAQTEMMIENLKAKNKKARQAQVLMGKMDIDSIRNLANKKLLHIRERINKLKEKLLSKEMAIKKKLMKIHMETTNLKMQLSLENNHAADQARAQEEWKRAQAKMLEDTMDSDNKKYKKEIADIDDEIKLDKKQTDKYKAYVMSKLKDLEEERAIQRKAHRIEGANLVKIKLEREKYESAKEKATASDDKKAKKTHAKLVKDMKKKLKLCSKKIYSEKKELERLKNEFEGTMGKIKALKDIKEQRAKAEAKVHSYEDKLVRFDKKAFDLNSFVDETCVGDMNEESSKLCEKYKKDIVGITLNRKNLQQEIEMERAHYLTL